MGCLSSPVVDRSCLKHELVIYILYINTNNNPDVDLQLQNIIILCLFSLMTHIDFLSTGWWKSNTRRKNMFYLMMHSTHFIYSYMVSDIW